MKKLISIIMPVKNGEKYLPQALDGILAQNMNTEILLIDDASTDNTKEIGQKYGCIVLTHEKTKGPVVCKNTGLRAAKGEYIMFHDGDDIMCKNTLSLLYEYLETHHETDMVMAKVQDFFSEDIINKNVHLRAEPYWGLFTGAVLMRQSLFDKIGLFNENVQAGEMIEFQQKMQKYGLNLHKMDFTATKRRIHDNNFGRTSSQTEFQDYAAILRQRLLKK